MRIANKQFQMIGEKLKFEDIPDTGVVSYKVGKKDKTDYWYNVYKLSEEQEREWYNWAWEELSKHGTEKEIRDIFVKLNLLYGFSVKYKKEGELF